MDAARKLVAETANERGLSLSTLSRKLGRNHAYLQQWIKRGIPQTLPERVRSRLAEELGLDEQALGAPLREPKNASSVRGERAMVVVPEHNVRASAGHGSLIEQETVVGPWPFPRDYVRNTLSLGSTHLSIIEVIGDSMMPTLFSGDKILIDLGDINVAQPGVFALYDGDATVVKRVERIPGSDELMLISDNPLHGRYQVRSGLVNVAGRVVWFGRRL